VKKGGDPSGKKEKRVMRIRSSLICLAILTVAASLSYGQKIRKSTAADQTGVEVTVYNNNLGLVKDVRQVRLGKGTGELRFMDVAASIMPVTVHVKSVDDPAGFTVLEQNYEYDLMDANKLLDKYVGKKIKLIAWNRFKDRKEEVEATLLSNNRGQVFRIGDKIYLGHPGVRVLPELPENLIAKPTLTWLYESSGDKPQKLEVSYLTNNINWKADYVVVLNKDDTAADLSGWVTLDNKSGATYKNARLKLVAGTVHRARPAQLETFAPNAAMRMKSTRKRFVEKAFFEYHIYDLQRKTTIKDKQTKQVSLLEAEHAEMHKELLVYAQRHFFTRPYGDRKPKQKVGVYVKFRNSKENNLGMPLPAGIMRLYKRDDDGSQQFIGEDRIGHTPKDEEVKLKIGEAFDVVAERTQVDYKRITTRMHESEWEIKVRNHKDKAVEVGLIEPLFGNWKIVSRNHPYKKLDAFTIRFDVKVPKDGETIVKYRVRVGI
jgi:hypothetical protein